MGRIDAKLYVQSAADGKQPFASETDSMLGKIKASSGSHFARPPISHRNLRRQPQTSSPVLIRSSHEDKPAFPAIGVCAMPELPITGFHIFGTLSNVLRHAKTCGEQWQENLSLSSMLGRHKTVRQKEQTVARG